MAVTLRSLRGSARFFRGTHGRVQRLVLDRHLERVEHARHHRIKPGGQRELDDLARAEMARQQGVPPEQIEDLFFWRESPRFTDAECAALALTEAMMHGNVSDDVYANLAKQFAPSEIIELALTAGFYAMVPRVLNALKVP